jgi:hypothetical protein
MACFGGFLVLSEAYRSAFTKIYSAVYRADGGAVDGGEFAAMATLSD